MEGKNRGILGFWAGDEALGGFLKDGWVLAFWAEEGVILGLFGSRSVVLRDDIRSSRFRPKSYTKFSVKFDFFDPSTSLFSQTKYPSWDSPLTN